MIFVFSFYFFMVERSTIIDFRAFFLMAFFFVL